MITIEEFVELFDLIEGEPEFEFFLKNDEKTYMMIKYNGHVTFQRCGVDGEGPITDFINLQELLQEELEDGFCLKNMWSDIDTVIADGMYDLSVPDDYNAYKEIG